MFFKPCLTDVQMFILINSIWQLRFSEKFLQNLAFNILTLAALFAVNCQLNVNCQSQTFVNTNDSNKLVFISYVQYLIYK